MQPKAIPSAFIQAGTRYLIHNAPNALTTNARPSSTWLRPRRRRIRSAAIRMEATAQNTVAEERDPGTVAGTSLRILKYPHPLLRADNATIDTFDAQLKQVAREMLRVMYASRGVGLAAPQVGINKRLMVFNPEGEQRAFLQEVVLVNPQIIASSKKTDVEMEGCLSFPGMSGRVRRHEWVKIEAQRLNGKRFKAKYEGWKARIFQHEFDHLEKTLYVDRLEEEDKANVKDTLQQLIQLYQEQPYENMQAAL